jgi:hypothetical protein
VKKVVARWPFLLLTLVCLLFILVVWSLGIPSLAPPLACFINPFIEQATGETPEAKVSAYLEAIRQGDQVVAYDCWRPANERLGSEYEARRQAAIEAVSALGSGLSFRIQDVQWWSNCCEPGVINDPGNAGFARLRVAVAGTGEDEVIHVFDVGVTGGPYYGEMMGCPTRHWEIIDAYPEGEEPLYWKWPAKQQR